MNLFPLPCRRRQTAPGFLTTRTAAARPGESHPAQTPPDSNLRLAAQHQVRERDERVSLLRLRYPAQGIHGALRVEEREVAGAIDAVGLQHEAQCSFHIAFLFELALDHRTHLGDV